MYLKDVNREGGGEHPQIPFFPIEKKTQKCVTLGSHGPFPYSRLNPLI